MVTGKVRRKVIVTGHAMAPKGTVLYERNKLISVAVEIDWESGEILNVDSTFATSLCNNFLRYLLVGKNILEKDKIRKEIEDNFLVTSQKSLLKALEMVRERYCLLK
ncbi:DUF3870 domain-containing protein [Moorella stamsii]|nr:MULTISPECIES: DUF3870 domain-containing protein [Moorella]